MQRQAGRGLGLLAIRKTRQPPLALTDLLYGGFGETANMAKDSMYGVRCSCGYDFDLEDMHDLITYWGEDGPKTVECCNCERTLTIEEHVERTYTVSISETISPTTEPDEVAA